MYRIEDVLERCNNESIQAFEVRLPNDIVDKGIMFGDLDNFFKFVKLTKSKHIFFTQVVAEPEDYMISEKTIRRVLGLYGSDDIVKCIDSNIDEYNNRIENLKLDYPVSILFACAYEGQMFYTCVENEITLDGEEVLEPEEVLEYMVAENEDKILKTKDKREKLFEEQKDKLKDYILNDKKFYLSTNQGLRRAYIQELFEKKMGKGYGVLKEYWGNSFGLPNQDAIYFVEMLWKEYGKKKK